MSRHRKCILMLLICCPVVLAGLASAQTIKTEIKTSTPLPAGAGATIDTLVQGYAANLAKDDAEARKLARDSLIGESDTASNTASAAYQTAYATSVAKALQPLLNPKSNRQVRLNAAIAIGQVAAHVSRTDSADVFLPLATLLLQSNDFESQLWGIKTAKYVLASLANKNVNFTGLEKKIVATVEKSRQSGDLIEEAYQALTFEPLRIAGAANINAIMGKTVSDVFDLVEWRISQYKAGIPNNPQGEWIVCSLFPGNFFPVISANPAIKARALKDFGDLACVQLKAMVNLQNNGNAGGQLQQELISAINASGRGIDAVGTQVADVGLGNVGKAIGIVNANNVQKLGDLCEDAVKAFKNIGIILSP